jgi:hypothetical protein
MPFIKTDALQQEQLPDALIEEYRQAVEAAWADVTPEVRGFGSRPAMFLQLQDPSRDRRTVTVTVGISGQYGGTSAKSPAELREALVKPFRGRFAPGGSAASGG